MFETCRKERLDDILRRSKYRNNVGVEMHSTKKGLIKKTIGNIYILECHMY